MEHECAKRVPDKPLRPFGDTCLFDIYLRKLRDAYSAGGPALFAHYGIALYPGDKRLYAKAVREGTPLFHRDWESRSAHNDLATQFNFLQGIDCDWFLWPNGCAPFLTVETILDIARQFHEGEPHPITTVREKRGWIWNYYGGALNRHAGSTQNTQLYHGSTYNVHVFSKKQLSRYGHYWDRGFQAAAVQMYVMRNEVETMDIDTMEDFEACEKAWRERHG